MIFGTRPEAIKLVPLVRMARIRGWDVRMWWTGQHDEMVEDVLSHFEATADVRLNALQSCRSVSQVFAYVLNHVDELLQQWRPDITWVQGDTTTAAAGALAAFHLGRPVGHVEAGLRTYDLTAPFPEEANRQVISRVSSFHYAPTESARLALLNEHVDPDSITVTGNTGIDALMLGVELARKVVPTRVALGTRLLADAIVGPGPLNAEFAAGSIILVTTHRRENHGQRLVAILDTLAGLARERPETVFVYPVHPNPNVRTPVLERLSTVGNVLLTNPLTYATLCATMDACSLVITDSGGLQEEAVSMGVPVVVLRTKTERPEGVDAGLAMLAGHEPKRIRDAVATMELHGRGGPLLVYGDGHACERIIDFTEQSLR